MAFDEFFDYPDGADADPAAPPADAGPVLGRGWTVERWDDLLEHTERLRLRAGERLVREGEVERAIYLIESGQLDAVVAGHNRTRRAPIGPGEVFGEAAFFDGNPRTADVVARTDATVRRLTVADLESLSGRQPDLAQALLMELGAILAFRTRRAEGLNRR